MSLPNALWSHSGLGEDFSCSKSQGQWSASSSQSESESTASIIADQEVPVINLTKNS